MKRDEGMEKLKAQLDRWNVQADAWEAKVRSMRAELGARYDRQLDALRGKRELSAAALHDMGHGYDAAWRELRAAFDRALSRFKASAVEHGREPQADLREERRDG